MHNAITPLWPQGAPGALGTSANDIPSLTAYLPEPAKRNGATMLILPGGGYEMLADHEGQGYADLFVAQGVSCFVLQYRLGGHGYRHPRMLEDAARGLRTVRLWARNENLDTTRVGVIGSSAGGHLASTLLTKFDAGNATSSDPIERESSRPDLGILCYPVISGVSFPHQGSFVNLLGKDASPELIKQLSSELNVTPETPPTFIWHTVEDRTVPVENALLFASALQRNGVLFDLHIYQNGHHGLGLPRGNPIAPPWDRDLLFWLGQRKFI